MGSGVGPRWPLVLWWPLQWCGSVWVGNAPLGSLVLLGTLHHCGQE